MSVFRWLLCGCYALEILVTILMIDEPRKPRTQADAAGAFVINSLIIVGIVWAW